MKIYTPQYYHSFRCIAAACPDSCCKDWAVDVDPDAAACYRALPGQLGDRLRAVLQDTDDGTCMQIENGRCPMWRDDGLCRIQAALGHDALCEVCRTFPRLRHDYGTFVELGLELSCPEAARLILTAPAQMHWELSSDEGETDYDADAMEILLHSRQTTLQLLADESLTVPEALAVLLLWAHETQAVLDGGQQIPFCVSQALEDARHYATGGNLPQLLDFFRSLEILTPAWAERLSSPKPGPWIGQFRALARYFVMRWWLQAVADYDLISRAKLTVTACLVVHALGGDMIQTAQQFSKEIENDPDNIARILGGAYTSPALTDVQLLSLLLNA